MQKESASAIYRRGAKENEKKDICELYSCIFPPEQHAENSDGPQQATLNDYMRKLLPVEMALSQILSAALSVATGVHTIRIPQKGQIWRPCYATKCKIHDTTKGV
jgi:hypothetical protein